MHIFMLCFGRITHTGDTSRVAVTHVQPFVFEQMINRPPCCVYSYDNSSKTGRQRWRVDGLDIWEAS
jgi:hypothetical protein